MSSVTHVIPRLLPGVDPDDPRLHLDGFEIGRTYPVRPAGGFDRGHFMADLPYGWERFILSDGSGGTHLSLRVSDWEIEPAGYFEFVSDGET